MKIAFDFDGTLEYEEVQDIAKKKIEEGHEVWIVTTRFDSKNRNKYIQSGMSESELVLKEKNLLDVAQALTIPVNRIHYTNMNSKIKFLEKNNFTRLYDNDETYFNSNILLIKSNLIIYVSDLINVDSIIETQLEVELNKFIIGEIEIYKHWTDDKISEVKELHKRRILASIENYITDVLKLDLI